MAKPRAPKGAALTLVAVEGEAQERTVARALLDPSVTAANTLNRLNGNNPESDINAFVAELRAQADAASAGNLGRSEAMLMGQAATLDALFHALTGWALNHAGERGSAAHFETCMRLALKAQSQSRATNETLAAIKNPPVVYARQANFAAGHQQVNNGLSDLSRVREIETPPTKLLEGQHGERLDTGTTAPPSGANQAMETVGAIDGTANG